MMLPAAAKLLPVVLPESMMLVAPLGSITEFLRATSFLGAVLISDISPTLGRALEFLKQSEKGYGITLERGRPLTALSFRFCALLGWAH